MTDLNDVKLIGRIVKDSTLEQTADMKYAKFAIAVNRDVKTQNGTWESAPIFVDLAIFDNYAEKMYQYLRKGTLILVQGSLKPRHWTKDDQKFTTLGVAVKNIQLLSSAKNSEKTVESSENPEFDNTLTDDINSSNVEPTEFEVDTQGVF